MFQHPVREKARFFVLFR